MFKNYTLRLPSVFRYLLLLSIIIIISLSRSIPLTYADPSADLTVQIQDDVQLAGVTRFGINLGAQDRYGAAQLLKNLVINPGFEAGEHQMLFNVAENPEAWHVQADNWDIAWNNPTYQIGQPEGYWKRGSYFVLSGPTRGRTGPIANFTYENNLYTFALDGGTKPQVGDVFVVRKEIAGYNGDSSTTAVADPYNNRPNTVGQQSLKLKKSADSSPSFRYIMDSFYRDSDRTAGKLLIADGKWHFEIWAKSEASADTLEVKFYRDNEATFFTEQIPLTNQWQKIERDFVVAPGSDSAKIYDPAANVPHPVLILTLNNRSSSSIWVDDIALQRPNTAANPTVFNDTLVERLQELQPGVLRDWGDQLGSSLDNQLAAPMARKMTAYGPDKQVATNFHYSLPEFLQLAELIGANPWYVIPTSFSDAEINNLIAYLSAPVGSHPYADLRQQLGRTEPWTIAFETIHLELGNELWGSAKPNSDPFVGGTVRGGVRTAEVANATYAAMRANQWFDANRFDLIIGSQHAYPGRTQEIESNSSNHDRIGIAPYFGRIETWNNDEELYYPLFASAIEAILPTGKIGEAQSYLDQAGQGSSLAIYEINLHSSAGSADLPIEVRNKVVTSLAAGIALPFHMMTYQQTMGIRTQAMWRAAEYAFRLSSGDYVHLSGGLRDIEATGRKRPSWLGLELVNKAIGGDLITTNFMSKVPTYTQSPFNGIAAETNIPLVNAFTYKNEGRYATVLFNLDMAQSHAVSFQLPFTPGYAAISTLANSDLFANNESAENVRIDTKSGAWTGDKLTLPAHSITVVEWSTTPIILIPTPTVSPTPFPIPSTPTLTATPFVPSTPTTTSTPTATPFVPSTPTTTPTPTATPFFPSTPTTTSTPIATATVPSTPTATPSAGVPTAVTMKSAETATLSTLLFIIPLSLIVATVGIYHRRLKRHN